VLTGTVTNAAGQPLTADFDLRNAATGENMGGGISPNGTYRSLVLGPQDVKLNWFAAEQSGWYDNKSDSADARACTRSRIRAARSRRDRGVRRRRRRPDPAMAVMDLHDRGPGPGSGTSRLIERLHDLGKPVWTTADTLYRDIDPDHPREDLRELVRLGVDGIITDRPELCREVLAE
jgi:hypothetical protein